MHNSMHGLHVPRSGQLMSCMFSFFSFKPVTSICLSLFIEAELKMKTHIILIAALVLLTIMEIG